MFPTLKLHLIFFSLLFLLLISDPLVHLSLGPSLLQLLIFSWSWSLHYFNISSFQSQKPILYYIKLWIKPGQVTHICIYTIFKTPIGNILSLIYNQELYLSRINQKKICIFFILNLAGHLSYLLEILMQEQWAGMILLRYSHIIVSAEGSLLSLGRLRSNLILICIILEVRCYYDLKSILDQIKGINI